METFQDMRNDEQHNLMRKIGRGNYLLKNLSSVAKWCNPSLNCMLQVSSSMDWSETWHDMFVIPWNILWFEGLKCWNEIWKWKRVKLGQHS